MTDDVGELRLRCGDLYVVARSMPGEAEDFEIMVSDARSLPPLDQAAEREAVARLVRASSVLRRQAWERYLALGGDLESFKRGEQ